MSDKFDLNKLVLVGETAEASLRRTSEILRDQGLNPNVTIELFQKSKVFLVGTERFLKLFQGFFPKRLEMKFYV